MKTLFFAIFLLMTYSATFAQNNPAGKVLITSACASGGDDYYFFEGGKVIAQCSGCEDIVLVKTGLWKDLGKGKYALTWEKIYRAKPAGKIIAAASVNIYDNYVAVSEKTSSKETVSLQIDKNSCEKIETHQKKFDPHFFLRTDYQGNFSFASEREISEDELAGLSRAELGIMRNEIFARYGYSFKSEAVKEYLSRQKNYSDRSLSDVAAFLSEIEQKNILKIKAEEAKR